MLLLCIACLISFSPGTFGSIYQLEGHLNTVRTAQVEGKEHKRGLFQDIEKEILGAVRDALERDVDEFFISHFELHGPRKTPIFHAYLKTDLKRNAIIQYAESSSKLTVFYLKEIDAMPTPPSITASGIDAAVSSCSNGGVLLPNSTCACPAFFKGDQCQTAKCLHQGIQEDSRCSCPPGVYSMNCEPRSCLPAVEETLDISTRSFVLVLNTKSSMAYVLNSLFFNMQSFLNETATNYKIANYIVVTYVSGVSYDYVTPRLFTSPDAVVSYLYGVVHVSDGNAEQNTNYAIFTAETFSSQIQPFSSIFVFTDSLDSDAKPVDYTLSSGTIENEVILQTNAWRHKIMYFISQPKGKPLDDSDDFYGTYTRVAQATLGDIVSYDQTEINKVISPLMSSYQFVEFIEARYSSSANQTIALFPDDPQQTVKILITVSPSGILPSVLNQNGQPLKSDVNGARFMLISVNSTMATNLTVISGGSSWSAKAFVSSESTAVVSYSLDPQIDVGDAFTSAELSNVATIAPLGFTGPIILSWKNIQTGSAVFAGTVAKQRTQECTFSWATAPINTVCSPGPFVQYLSLKSGIGNVVRVIPGFCGILDHTSPPPFQCFNGGTKNDDNSCTCASNFDGVDCSIPICLYGGSPNPFPGNGKNLCNCPQGYLGDHCETLTCRSSSPSVFNNYARSFGMVMQASMSQSQISGSIHQGLAEMLGLLTDSGDLFNAYYLTTFSTGLQNGANSSRILTQTFQTASQFSSAVNHTGYLASSTSTQDSFGALFDAMRHSNFDRSSFFLFVDSPPSATANEMEIILNAIERDFEINIIITPPFQMEDLCLTKPDPFITIAQKTGGVIYNLCNPYGTYSGDPIVEFFHSFGISHHHTENVAEGASPSCRAQTELVFHVDNSTAQHFLIVNSDNTEKFVATLTNLDTSEEITLTPISNTPMLAVYDLTVDSSTLNGYSAKIVAAPNASYGSCYSRIAEKTSVAAYLGFSPDPSQDARFKTLTFATPRFPVVHLDRSNEQPVVIDAVDDQGSQHYSSIDVKREISCNYESYFTEPFICDSIGGTFILNIKTTTSDGVPIQRSRRALCYIEDTECLNGKSYYNGQCQCAPDYYGDHCEFPRCQNGAEYRDYQCICGTTLSGPVCQYETCSKMNFMESADPRESNFRQITFVVNINMDQVLVNSYLSNIIQKFVDDTETDVPKQYSLLLFDESTVTKVASTSRASEFVSIFRSAMTKMSTKSGIPTISLDAINEAYKINIDPPSIIYLFTGSDAARSSVISSLIKQRLGTQVNIIYTPANVVYPGQPGGSYGAYLSIAARQSGGRIWPLTQNSISQLEPALASTVVANAFVFDDAAKDCTSPTSFSFTLDPYFTTVYIEITGIDVNQPNRISFNNNLYGNLTVNPSMILFKDNAAIIYAIQHIPNTLTGGQWDVTVQTTSGPCFVQVRTKSPVRVVPGFTSNINSDFVKELPFSQYGTKKESYMTFRLVDQGTSNLFSYISRVDIQSGDFDKPWSGAKALGSLSVKQRDSSSCASQYVSELWGLNSQSFQKFVIYGTAGYEYEFQRTFFYYFGKPSAADIAASCQFGQRNQNGECICDDSHSGDYCTDRICQNGGSQSFGICVCPDGYYGDYCESFVGYTPSTTPSAFTTYMSSATPTQSSSTSTIASQSSAPSTTISSSPPAVSSTIQSTKSSATQQTTTQSSSSSSGTPLIGSTTQKASSVPPLSSTIQSTSASASTQQTTTQFVYSSFGTQLPVISSTTQKVDTTTSTLSSTPTVSSTTYGSTVSTPIATTTVPQSQSSSQTSTWSSTSPTVTATAPSVPSTIGTTTTEITTVLTTTVEMTTEGSTATTILHCDPYTTTYMVSIFLDATDMFSDPFMGTIYKGEDSIVQSLAQQLYLGNGMSNTRFVLSSIASGFQTVGNVTSQDDISAALQGLASPKGADLVYNMTNALEQYQATDMWQFGKMETPPIAVFFSATPVSDMDSVPDQLDQLSKKGYKTLAVNVGFDDTVQSQLTSLFGSDSVYESITVDDTATWLRNKICKLKPL